MRLLSERCVNAGGLADGSVPMQACGRRCVHEPMPALRRRPKPERVPPAGRSAGTCQEPSDDRFHCATGRRFDELAVGVAVVFAYCTPVESAAIPSRLMSTVCKLGK